MTTKETIIEMRSNGKPYAEIARVVGLSYTRVYNLYNEIKHDRQDVKKKVLSRDEFTCRFCFTSKGPMEVHHIDGNRRNNKMSNQFVLCLSCHKDFHRKNKK